jgi:hypothetical protein
MLATSGGKDQSQCSYIVCGSQQFAEQVAILSDQSNREDRKKKEVFSKTRGCRSESVSFS